MSPPTEQLIRDYLNRLSVAARDALSADDRKALVGRARDFIERHANPSSPATPMEVAALLSRLGDPANLVSQEAARLAEARGETLPAEDSSPERRRLLPGRTGQPSWHWPRQAGQPGLQARLLYGEGTEPEVEPPIWVPRQVPAAEEEFGDPDQDDGDQDAADQGDAPAGGRPAWPSLAATPDSGAGTEVPEAVDTGPEREPADTGPAREPADTGPAREPADDSGAAASPRSAGAGLTALLAQAKGNMLESVAVTLLGLGGAIYPPVWLLGVLVALPSRVWDYRDKWVGLVGPVLLLVVGIVVGIALDGPHRPLATYIHQAWLYADVLSRLLALLGAAFLARRVMHVKRMPIAQGWHRTRRTG